MYRKDYIKNVNRVVIKVGSSTLTYPDGHLNISRLDLLVRQIADLRNRNIEVILVTSGAIGAGMGKLGFKTRPKTMPEKQAAAAVGQCVLMHMYEKLFAEYGQTVGQILLTREDVNDRVRFLNARNSIFTLIQNRVVPIINENDAVVVDEIKFGDNDTLSAMVSSLIEADLLILLSDIDGLYTDDPRVNKNSELISCVEKIDEEIEGKAKGAGSSLGTGGMHTKIQAANIAVSSGTAMVIANGSKDRVILDILDGQNEGTWFMPCNHPMQARKRWIAFSIESKGEIVIDSGAQDAILNGKSLLPGGIIKVNGSFSEGQAVDILNDHEVKIGKGIVNYNSLEIESIKGLKTCEIQQQLQHKYYDEVIHRDNMVILVKGEYENE